MAEREMLGEVYIPPTQCHCKDYTNIGKISFHRQDHKFIKVECPVLFCLAISIPSLSVSPYTVTPQSATLYVPNLLVTSNCSAQLCMSANCGGCHSIFYRSCPVHKLESEVAVLKFKLGLTIHKTRQEACWQDFSLASYSNAILHSAPLPSEDVSGSPPVSLTPTTYYPASTPSLPQSKSFSSLNPDI